MKANSQQQDSDNTEATGENDPPADAPANRDDANSSPFLIRDIDINDATFEVAESDFSLTFDRLHIAGLEAQQDGARMGTFTIEGSHVSLKTEPLDESGTAAEGMHTRARFTLKLKKGAHQSVKRDVNASGTVNFSSTGQYAYSLFDGKMKVSSEAGTEDVHVDITGLTPDEYVTGICPGQDISLTGTTTQGEDGEMSFVLERGSVNLLGHTFEFVARTYSKDDSLLAQCIIDGTTYTCALPPRAEPMKIAPILTSDPDRSLEDILGQLLFQQPSGDCTVEQQEQVATLRQRFGNE